MTNPEALSSRLPGYLRVADWLRERIRNGTFRAGEYLPAERELAREVGVNRKTLRLAIEELGREGLVRQEERRGNRVLDDPAPAPRKEGSRLAGLVIYEMSRGGSAITFRGCHAALHHAGYDLIVSETWRRPRWDADCEAQSLRRLIDRRVDGIILYADPTGENQAMVLEALAQGIHVVQIDRYLPGVETDYVGIDNVHAALDAVHHLADLGHRRIAFLGNAPSASTVGERLEGYRQALAGAGLEADPALVGCVDRRRGTELATYREVVRGWLALPEPPTAVFALNDEMAWFTIQALVAEGCEVPRDVAVMGFDNQPLATVVQPTLSTVAQPFMHVGEMAAQLLLDRISGRAHGPARRILLPTQLIVRESSGVAVPNGHSPVPAGVGVES